MLTNRIRHFSSEGCFAPFDTNSNGMLSIDEFTELCYKLFVGADTEVDGGIYDFDPEAIFKWLTEDAPSESGIEDTFDDPFLASILMYRAEKMSVKHSEARPRLFEAEELRKTRNKLLATRYKDFFSVYQLSSVLE